MSRFKHPSPALVISILALVAASAVPAFALTKSEKKTVKKLANAQITKRAPGLAVARASNANTAANADKLDGQDATDFTPAGEVHNSGRVVLNDPLPGDLAGPSMSLFMAGPFDIRAGCIENLGGGATDTALVAVGGPNGTSFSGPRSDGVDVNLTAATEGQILVNSSGNQVRGGQLTAVAPNGEVLSMSASAEVGDPAGDCVVGVTALGP